MRMRDQTRRRSISQFCILIGQQADVLLRIVLNFGTDTFIFYLKDAAASVADSLSPLYQSSQLKIKKSKKGHTHHVLVEGKQTAVEILRSDLFRPSLASLLNERFKFIITALDSFPGLSMHTFCLVCMRIKGKPSYRNDLKIPDPLKIGLHVKIKSLQPPFQIPSLH